MANDARGTGRENNAKFSANQINKTAKLVALKPISKEIFVSYGEAFWPGRAKKQEAKSTGSGKIETGVPAGARQRADAPAPAPVRPQGGARPRNGCGLKQMNKRGPGQSARDPLVIGTVRISMLRASR
jgi:hypothetical protein